MTTIANALPSMVAYWDNNLICRYANNAHFEWFNKKPSEIVGRTFSDLLGDQLFAANQDYLIKIFAGQRQSFERTITNPNGIVGHRLTEYIPDFDEEGNVIGFLVLSTDITMTKQMEFKLRDSEARYRLLADNSADMVFQLDRDGVRQYMSPASREVFGYEPEELIGTKPIDQIHPDDVQRVQQIFHSLFSGQTNCNIATNRIRHRDGRWIWVEVDFRALKDAQSGEVSGIVGALRDISARKEVEDQLSRANQRLAALADRDWLTGLANRRVFDEALFREFAAEQNDTYVGLIMIDVDWFKSFNDRYGHPAGDECLRQVGAAIETAIHRPRNVVARYGGEEFVVLLPDTDEPGTRAVAECILQAISGLAITHAGSSNGVVTASAGVASMKTSSHEKPSLLVDLADRALYRAKEAGKNQVARASDLARGAEVRLLVGSRASHAR